MFSLIIGLLFGFCVLVLAFTDAVRPGPATIAIALAGISLMLKTYLIFTLGGGS